MKFNKKKIACFALASALVIPGVIGLAGCEKAHTHAFNSDPFYEVVTEGETKIARSWRECSCGAEDAHKKVENAVIATPETAQNILDGNINNKIIVFDEGDYSRLEIRPTKDTATIYEYETTTDTETGTPTYLLNTVVNTSIEELPKTNAHYTYKREISNVTFAGTEGAVFKGIFTIQSQYAYHKLATTNPDHITYDYIRQVEMYETASEGNNSCVSWINVDDITLERMNFYGQNGRIYSCYTFVGPTFNNFSITNCSFDTETRLTATYAAVRMQSNVNIYKNFKLNNNKVNNFFQGLYVANVENIEMIGNETSNTTHNNLVVAKETKGIPTGNIIIKNNKIIEAHNQSIKIHQTTNSNIFITDNTIINTVKNSIDWPWVIQIGGFKVDKVIENEVEVEKGHGSYTVSGNTFNGEKMAEISDSHSNAKDVTICIAGVEPEIEYPEEIPAE